jgi:hypothetical protein
MIRRYCARRCWNCSRIPRLRIQRPAFAMWCRCGTECLARVQSLRDPAPVVRRVPSGVDDRFACAARDLFALPRGRSRSTRSSALRAGSRRSPWPRGGRRAPPPPAEQPRPASAPRGRHLADRPTGTASACRSAMASGCSAPRKGPRFCLHAPRGRKTRSRRRSTWCSSRPRSRSRRDRARRWRAVSGVAHSEISHGDRRQCARQQQVAQPAVMLEAGGQQTCGYERDARDRRFDSSARGVGTPGPWFASSHGRQARHPQTSASRPAAVAMVGMRRSNDQVVTAVPCCLLKVVAMMR